MVLIMMQHSQVGSTGLCLSYQEYSTTKALKVVFETEDYLRKGTNIGEQQREH